MFQHQHINLLGNVSANAYWTHGYLIQVFAYGALVFDSKARKVYLLPVGDRLLAAQGFLPDRPGNVYPAGFAPVTILKAVGWIPHR
jgi:hypothetical protein